MVIMTSGIARGRVRTTTATESRNMAAISLRKQPSLFAPGPSGVSREGRLRFTAENSILMT